MMRVYAKALVINFVAIDIVILLNYLIADTPKVSDEIALFVGLIVGLGVYFSYTKPELDKLRMERDNGK